MLLLFAICQFWDRIATVNISLPPAGCLSSRDLFTLLEELKPARAQWHYIGLGLGISHGDLQSIASMTKESLDGLREVLVLWLDQLGPPRTWPAVVNVLRSSVVDKKSLALQLETKYCSSTEPN